MIYELLRAVASDNGVLKGDITQYVCNFANCTVLTAMSLLIVTMAVKWLRGMSVNRRLAFVVGGTMVGVVGLILLSLLWVDGSSQTHRQYAIYMVAPLMSASMV